MRISIQLVFECDSDEALPETVKVSELMRGALQPESLGLRLAEGRSILAGIEQAVALALKPESKSYS